MHPRTLGRWRALYQIDPWDESRGDARAAMLAAATVNAAGATKRDGSPVTSEDFMPFARLQMDPDELARIEVQRQEAALLEFLMNASGHEAHAFRETD